MLGVGQTKKALHHSDSNGLGWVRNTAKAATSKHKGVLAAGQGVFEARTVVIGTRTQENRLHDVHGNVLLMLDAMRFCSLSSIITELLVLCNPCVRCIVTSVTSFNRATSPKLTARF
jgi:hypothetical protein